jgi:prepilin-type processing-associated H-X9-DG protein
MYLATNWDDKEKRNIKLSSFTDGTSNTVVFSEFVKGVANGVGYDGLGEVYKLTAGNCDSEGCGSQTDYQIAQLCQTTPINASTRSQHWKGEWWAWAPSQIYSHTIPPNRTACGYSDQNTDDRATISLSPASSLHPGGVNTLMGDGSVRFVKSSVNYITWYALATPDRGEVISADAY